MTTSLTRRQFGVAAAGFLTAPNFIRARGAIEKMNIAIVGVGGRGGGNLAAVGSEYVTALCDVNQAQASFGAAVKKYPAARTFTDFRKMFEKPEAFDAVVVSTCEHTHAFATMMALKQKKHVYCEKPLTHNIWEARRIREEAAKAGVITQMGIQIHAMENYRRVVELVQANIIGPVKEVHVWVSRAWGLQSEEAAKRNKDIVFVTERPKQESPIPKGVDWDLWLGPAPYRPFNDVYFPGPKWYRWWDFGNGTMSDLGSHWNDLPFWALNLKAPLTVEANGPNPHPEIAPATMSATYTYAARGTMPAVKLTWYQGEMKPDIWTKNGIPQWSDGCLFIGEKGMILANYGKHVILPEKEFADVKRPPKSIPASPGHQAEWIECCKTGKQPSANFEYSGWLTEANHLGNVAFRVGKKLEWDAEKLKATNTADADPFIKREYRKGWEL